MKRELTNQTLQQLYDRKSVRVYEDRSVEEDVKQAILSAALQAPTAGNMALYTIWDITDPESKAVLAEYVRRFCKRKWHSDFSREMSRSCAEMVKDWCSG